MRRRLPHPPLLGFAVLLLGPAAACDPGVGPVEVKPATLQVTLTDGASSGCFGDGGLLDFEAQLSFRVEALDSLGQPYLYDGPVAFRMAPGKMNDPGLRYTMVQGVLSKAPLRVRLSFGGRAHVWAELTGQDGRQATGVSPDLCFKTPKISDVQRYEDGSHVTDFDGEQVAFRGDRLVATATDSKGFFVTDLDAAEYGSIYVFTFGNPTGVKAGSCLCEVSGGIKEFLHFTEVVFPTWRVFKPGGREAAAVELEEERDRVGDDEVPDPRHDESIIFEECMPADLQACSIDDPFERERRTVPAPVRLDPAALPDVGVVPWDDRMKELDKHEASLVAIGPVHLPDAWENCDINRDGEVFRCFGGSRNPEQACPALNSASERQVMETVCAGGVPVGGCGCSCGSLRESVCTNECAATPGCAERGAYEEFGQFGVTAGEGDRRINLVTRVGMPELQPVDDPRSTIHCVVGNLRQVAAAPIPWVIQPRRPSDLMFDPPPPGTPDPCAE